MYIFVPSYPSIYFAIHKSEISNNVTIITNNESVKKTALLLKINNIFFDFELNFKGFFKKKKKIVDLLNSLDLSREFYLLDNIHCLDGFFLAKKWTKGKVYYQNLSTEFSIYERQISFKNNLIKLIYEYFLEIDLIFRNQNDKPFLGISDYFIKRNGIKFLGLQDYDILKLKVINSLSLKIKEYDNLLILQGSLKGVITQRSLLEVYSVLQDINSLVVKEHPKHKTSNLFLSKDRIPDYFPVELCYLGIKRNIISIFSLSLILAGNIQEKNAISLLEIVKWESESHKRIMKDVLINGSNNILFPKDLNELKIAINS